jgi:hypothetical protein
LAVRVALLLYENLAVVREFLRLELGKGSFLLLFLSLEFFFLPD